MQTDLAIHPLTPDRLSDHLRFFDHDAFVDNPRWGFCYCNFLYADHDEKPWTSRTTTENRSAIIPLIETRRFRGYLAYRDGQVVGWCNAGPKAMVPILADPLDPDASEIGATSCFLVAPSRRGQGIARALLEHACEDFAAAGLAYAEGYPVRNATTPAANHFGPLTMFLSAGFEIVSEDEERYTVRRKL